MERRPNLNERLRQFKSLPDVRERVDQIVRAREQAQIRVVKRKKKYGTRQQRSGSSLP